MLLPLLATLSVAVAQSTPVAPPLVTVEGTSIDAQGRPLDEHPYIGVQIEAGVPDGAAAGLSVMPFSFMRLQLAGLSNGVGAGVRFGVALVAFPRWPVRPFISADGGYVFAGALPWALDLIDDATLRSALSNVNVGFVSAHAGLELGSQHVALVLRAGVSYLDVEVGAQNLQLGSSVTVTATGSRLTGFIPSARLGLLFCF